MTQGELNKKIADINREEVGPEEKTRRINLLTKVYNDEQTRLAEEAKSKHQSAETDLKNNLKQAYMQNPVATEEDFERDYPQMRSDYLKQKALETDNAVRRRSSEAARNYF